MGHCAADSVAIKTKCPVTGVLGQGSPLAARRGGVVNCSLLFSHWVLVRQAQWPGWSQRSVEPQMKTCVQSWQSICLPGTSLVTVGRRRILDFPRAVSTSAGWDWFYPPDPQLSCTVLAGTGFTHQIPNSAAHAVLRSQMRRQTVIRLLQLLRAAQKTAASLAGRSDSGRTAQCRKATFPLK